MIQRFAPRVLDVPGQPRFMANERVYLDCGCSVFVGVRLDTTEGAVACAACSANHAPLIEEFHRAFVETLPSDSTRPAAEVADELLTAVAWEAP